MSWKYAYAVVEKHPVASRANIVLIFIDFYKGVEEATELAGPHRAQGR